MLSKPFHSALGSSQSLGLLMAVWIHAAVFAQPAAAPPPANVRVDVVRLSEVRQRRLVTGQIEPGRRSLLAAEVSGRVVQAPPEPGTAVQAGQVLARVNEADYQLSVQRSQATLEQLQAQLEERENQTALTRLQSQRLEKLVDTNAAFANELEDTQLLLAVHEAQQRAAAAAVRRAQVDLQQAEADLAKAQIASPFDGFIVSKQTEVGQWLDSGDGVVEVVEVRRMKVRLQVSQDLLAAVQPQEPIMVHIDSLQRSVELPLFSIVPDGDPQSRTFSVLLKMDNEDGSVRAGMSVGAEIPTGRQVQALTVPRDAVLTTPTGTVVFINRNATAAMVPVTIRFSHGNRFVVDGELKDGDQVIVEGNERLRPGQSLRVQNEPPAAGEKSANGS